jgi:hypothetical protein
MFDINTIGYKGFGFKHSKNEADAWEVKRHQDAMAMHENADGTFSQRASTKAELGGYRQHWRAGKRNPNFQPKRRLTSPYSHARHCGLLWYRSFRL